MKWRNTFCQKEKLATVKSTSSFRRVSYIVSGLKEVSFWGLQNTLAYYGNNYTCKMFLSQASGETPGIGSLSGLVS